VVNIVKVEELVKVAHSIKGQGVADGEAKQGRTKKKSG